MNALDQEVKLDLENELLGKELTSDGGVTVDPLDGDQDEAEILMALELLKFLAELGGIFETGLFIRLL